MAETFKTLEALDACWQWTRRSSFRLRAAWLPVAVVALFLAMFHVGGIALLTQQNAMKGVVETDLESSARLAQINSRLQSVSTDVYRLITQAAAESAEGDLASDVRDVARRVDAIIVDLQDYRASEAALLQRETLDRFIGDLKDYKVAVDWIASTLEIDFKASIAFMQPYNDHAELLSRQLSSIIADTTTTAKLRADAASEALRRVVYSFAVAAGAVSILVTLFGYLSDKHQKQLSRAAQEKSRQVGMLLDNSGQGFLSFGPNLVVDDSFSRFCISMFGVAPAGRAADDLLFPDDVAARELMRSCTADAMAESDPDRKALFLSLIPSEIRMGDNIMEAEYIPIEAGIMVVLSDVTEQRTLAAQMMRERQRLEMIVAAVTDAADFFAVIDEFRNFAQCGAAVWREGDPARLYRVIHTFKGSFNQFGFHHLPARLHAVEALIQAQRVAQKEESVAIVFAIDWIGLLERDLETVAKALGPDFVARRGVVTLSPEQAARFQRLATGLLASNSLGPQERAAAVELAAVRAISLRNALREFDQMIQRIATRLEKEVAPLVVDGDDVRLDPDIFGPFLRSLG
ncbi:MAG TPA: hypothetical protein VN809_01900, partial [Telmatospirillum sp.]|nr:hypothetical protein [Telmatospirillum sp.]